LDQIKSWPLLADIQAAQKRLNGIVLQTPMIFSPVFSHESGCEVFLKPENLQITGSFKIRGAYNKIAQLTDREKERGLITASAGNHAQGVAYSSQLTGMPAVIVMPTVTPLIKIEATKQYGAQVVLSGLNYDEAYDEAMRLQKKNDYVFIHPFNDIDIMAGQGTIGLEILAEHPDVDCILVPVGGGGLIGGIASAVKAMNPNIAVIGIEPTGAASMTRSREAGVPIRLDKVDTIADGVAVKRPGNLTFDASLHFVDDMINVTDQELTEAFLLLLERHKLISEASGLLSVAAAKHWKKKGQKVVAVISGGNIDVMSIASMIQSGLVERGRIFCFSVELPDVPGELLKVCQVLAAENANIVQVVHDQFKASDSLKKVNLEAIVETFGHQHCIEIIAAMERAGYQVKRVY